MTLRKNLNVEHSMYIVTERQINQFIAMIDKEQPMTFLLRQDDAEHLFLWRFTFDVYIALLEKESTRILNPFRTLESPFSYYLLLEITTTTAYSQFKKIYKADALLCFIIAIHLTRRIDQTIQTYLQREGNRIQKLVQDFYEGDFIQVISMTQLAEDEVARLIQLQRQLIQFTKQDLLPNYPMEKLVEQAIQQGKLLYNFLYYFEERVTNGMSNH